ncbi:hypothetical protein LCGC14_1405690 [marine sediment metagenome]|uniref:Uncharacterized protein n=1 Tax=marine sediment metagenome TaxID=412755 RepID=A0A0F9JW44_9ZZZZ
MKKKVMEILRWFYEGESGRREIDVAIWDYSVNNTPNMWSASILYMRLHTAIHLYLTDQLLPKKWRLFNDSRREVKGTIMGGKMYRPEGWENPYCLIVRTLRDIRADKELYEVEFQESAFEAGANAMLEGLKREKGAYVCSIDADKIKILKGDATKGGYLVLIPEEE